MELVYCFCETAGVRVPVFDNDPRILRLLSARGGGVWDSTRHEFIFGRCQDPGQFCRSIPGIPCVWVDAKAPVPVRVFGLRGYPVRETAGFNPGETDSLFINKVPLPDKFPGHWRIKLEEELRSRKYSLSTLQAYVYFNRLLCRTLQKAPGEIQPDDITRFLAGIEKNKGYSASTMNLAISAVKFFYNNVMKNATASAQRRPRHDKRLPVIPSKAEVNMILNMEKNPKHRLLLILAYSSGLRVSEVVALRKEHLDLERRVIYVRLGKGRKDRCTILSDKAADFIRKYYPFFDIKTWVFPGQPPDKHLTIRSAQHIFEKAAGRAGITKHLSIHSLRHAFATHLLESGTDTRYIQALLGHANIRTTERYTHVARRTLLRIRSPFDTMN